MIDFKRAVFLPFVHVASASYETMVAANVYIFGVVKQGGHELFGVEFNDVGFGEDSFFLK